MNNLNNFYQFLNERTQWTKEKLQEEADKCETRREFQKNHNVAYNTALRRGLLDELFKNHPNKGVLNKQVKKGYWTKERLKEEADKYQTRGEFLKNSPSAYSQVHSKKLLDEFFKDHPNQGHSDKQFKKGYWTKERLKEEADKYQTRGEFQKNNSAAYSIVHSKKLLDEFFKDHPNQGYSDKQFVKGYWTKERLQEEANKYKTRSEFSKNNSSAYGVALKKKLIDELFKNHPNNGYTDKQEPMRYWSDERLQNRVDKYKTRKEFQKNNSGAYQTASKKQILSDLFLNHDNYGYIKRRKSPRIWTKDILQKEVDKYQTRLEFQLQSSAAYNAASKRKLLDKLFKNHPNKGYLRNVKKLKTFENFIKNEIN